MELETSTTLGDGFTLEDLMAKGYDAVFMAVGAQTSRRDTHWKAPTTRTSSGVSSSWPTLPKASP